MRIKKITSVVSVLLLLTALGIVAMPHAARADLDLSLNFDLFGDDAAQPIAIAPPPLPIYIVPAPPMDGYVWAPGHWRWNGYGYFWVPGTWVQPPVVGVLWTPGYWGWREGVFAWHEGYWARHVGFYGGINYGGGYGGTGFVGGGWNGGRYHANPAFVNVTNVTNVTNNYNTTNITNNHASFAGGPGGTTAQPTPQEEVTANEHHIGPTPDQREHALAAARNPAFSAANNHGKPTIAATVRPNDFTHNVVAARAAGPVNPEAEQHNIQVKHNPEMAHGASLPQARSDQSHPAAAQQHQGPEQQRQIQGGGQQQYPQPQQQPQHEAAQPNQNRLERQTQQQHPAAPMGEAAPRAQARAPQQPHPQTQTPRPQVQLHPQAEHPAQEHGPEERGPDEHHE